MRRLLIAILTLFFGYCGLAQQTNQFSQYFLNKSLLNPAAMGLNSRLNMVLGYREQWAQFAQNSALDNGVQPKAAFFTGSYVLGPSHDQIGYADKSIRTSNPDLFKMHDSTSSAKHVVGGSIINNEMGYWSSTSIFGSYAYHYPVQEFNISAGISLGYNGMNLGTDYTVQTPNPDELYHSYVDEKQRTDYLDMNLGLMIYSHNFYFGLSSDGIIPNRIQLSGSSFDVPLNAHYYLSTGLKINATHELIFKPSILLRMVSGAPASYDINILADFHHFIYGGVSYRHRDAIIGIVGFLINNHYNLSYSYDFTTSSVRQYSSGSHEIMLGVRFK